MLRLGLKPTDSYCGKYYLLLLTLYPLTTY